MLWRRNNLLPLFEFLVNKPVAVQTLTASPVPMDFAAWRPRFDPGLSVWDMWWTKWHWDEVFSAYLNFLPLNIIPPGLHMYLLSADAIKSKILILSLHKTQKGTHFKDNCTYTSRVQNWGHFQMYLHCWAPCVKLQDYFEGTKWDSM
jgi:hypothetical protein